MTKGEQTSTKSDQDSTSCLSLKIVTSGFQRPSKTPVNSPLSPRKRKQKARDEMINRVVHIVSSPFPYMILLLLAAMIVLIFVDVMPISGLICISAIIMIVSLVVGNHWRGKPILAISSSDVQEDIGPLTEEDKIDNLNEFFEGLFNSLDYSLLFIFLGTFIVVANIDSTGIPRTIWWVTYFLSH